MIRSFRSTIRLWGLISVLCFSAGTQSIAAPAHRVAMGFTPWPVDFNAAGVARTYAFANAHSNLMAHHFDGGIPWDEALSGAPLPQHLLRDWKFRRDNTPARSKVYVAVTPFNFGRDGLAPAWTNKGDNKRLSREWRKRELDDPKVVEAYINYLRRVIAYFDPDFLAIGIEANLIISNAPAIWNDYTRLNAQVYRALKSEHPKLPVFTTIQYEHLRGIEDDSKANLKYQRPGVATLMKHSDLLALSTYQYGDLHPNPMTSDYFDEARAFGKKIAIAEFGAMSEAVKIFGTTLPASEAGQVKFVEGILGAATRHRFPFVVNWVAIDFDPGLKRLPRSVREVAKAWVHTGLKRHSGEDKPALNVWDSYLRVSNP